MKLLSHLVLHAAIFAILLSTASAVDKAARQIECWTATQTLDGTISEVSYIFADDNMFAQILTANGKTSISSGKYSKSDKGLVIWHFNGAKESGALQSSDAGTRYEIKKHSTDKTQEGDVVLFKRREITDDEQNAVEKILQATKWHGKWLKQTGSTHYLTITRGGKLLVKGAGWTEGGTWQEDGNELRITVDFELVPGSTTRLPATLRLGTVENMPYLVTADSKGSATYIFVGY